MIRRKTKSKRCNWLVSYCDFLIENKLRYSSNVVKEIHSVWYYFNKVYAEPVDDNSFGLYAGNYKKHNRFRLYPYIVKYRRNI